MSQGWWDIYIVGPSGSTLLNADGFYYETCPGETSAAGEPRIIVTYKLDRIDTTGITDFDDFWSALIDQTDTDVYNSNAGYEVYHFTL